MAANTPRPDDTSSIPRTALSADKPLDSPADDKLGYAPFAAAVAQAIARMEPADGMVIAVNGEWGLGKSTIINFIVRELEVARPNDLIVLPFNPWWFSGRADVAGAFLAQLRGMLNRRKVLTKKARQSLKTFSDAVGAIPDPLVGGAGRVAGKVVGPPEEDVPKLKKELDNALRKQDKHILVVIDDIDRLTGDELAGLFGAVKALADFPKVIYLLAFDKGKVAEALAKHTGTVGADYLEKIVQASFDVPLPEPAGLRDMFVADVVAAVGAVDDDVFDQDDWAETLLEGVGPLLDTPRDVVHLVNALRVSHAALGNNANFVDLVALETIRLHSPSTYDLIRRNPPMFGVLTGAYTIFGADPQKQAAFHKEWYDALPPLQRDPVARLVCRLFPDARKAMSTYVHGSSGPADHYKARRICVPELFPAYFRLGLDEEIAPRSVVRALIAQASNPAALGQSLLKMMDERIPSGRTRASVMLEELASQVDHFDANDIGPVIEMLIDIGDEFGIEADQDGWGGINNGTRLTHLIAGLLRRLPEEDRVDVLRRAIPAARSTLLPTLLVHRIEKGLGVPESGSITTTPAESLRLEDGLIGPAGMEELERLAAEKISERMQGDELWEAPRFQYLLRRWLDWGDRDEVIVWFDAVRADDHLLGKLLVSANSTRKTKAGRFRLDPAWFDEYVSRDELADDVRRLQRNSPEPALAEVCTQYLEELDHRQQGRDPEMVYW